MSNLRDIKLYCRDTDSEEFKRGKMTIRLDDRGDPEMFSGAPALDQDIIKAAMTGVQPDGYGTVIHKVVGDKNTQVVQSMIAYTVMASLQRLLQIHNDTRRRFPNKFRATRCLTSPEFVRVNRSVERPVRTMVTVDFRSRGDELRSIEADASSGKE